MPFYRPEHYDEKFMGWRDSVKSPGTYLYQCAHCGNNAAPLVQWEAVTKQSQVDRFVAVCPHCANATFIRPSPHSQFPEPLPGRAPSGAVPEDVAMVYEEARKCFAAGAHTASAMCSRKLLMNVAVAHGAQQNQSFASYVQYISDQHLAPPNAQPWLDYIRTKGNDATHEIPCASPEDAKQLLSFASTLLLFLYEAPAELQPPATPQP